MPNLAFKTHVKNKVAQFIQEELPEDGKHALNEAKEEGSSSHLSRIFNSVPIDFLEAIHVSMSLGQGEMNEQLKTKFNGGPNNEHQINFESIFTDEGKLKEDIDFFLDKTNQKFCLDSIKAIISGAYESLFDIDTGELKEEVKTYLGGEETIEAVFEACQQRETKNACIFNIFSSIVLNGSSAFFLIQANNVTDPNHSYFTDDTLTPMERDAREKKIIYLNQVSQYLSKLIEFEINHIKHEVTQNGKSFSDSIEKYNIDTPVTANVPGAKSSFEKAIEIEQHQPEVEKSPVRNTARLSIALITSALFTGLATAIGFLLAGPIGAAIGACIGIASSGSGIALTRRFNKSNPSDTPLEKITSQDEVIGNSHKTMMTNGLGIASRTQSHLHSHLAHDDEQSEQSEHLLDKQINAEDSKEEEASEYRAQVRP